MQTDMAELDSLQTAITQVAMQASAVRLKALKEAETTITGINMANEAEVHRPRNGGPALRQPAFSWKP